MRRLIFAAVAAGCAVAAQAQPPPRGSVAGFAQPSILCDTQEQLQSIVNALGESLEAGQARYLDFFKMMNAQHEPTCAIVPVRMAVTGETTDLGMLSIDGTDYRGWSVHVGNRAGYGYYLYLETKAETLRDYI
jgi:hypothetical protein